MNPINTKLFHFFGHHTYKKDEYTNELKCKYCSKVWNTNKKISKKLKESDIISTEKSPTWDEFLAMVKKKEGLKERSWNSDSVISHEENSFDKYLNEQEKYK
jgi:hypothetical protein